MTGLLCRRPRLDFARVGRLLIAVSFLTACGEESRCDKACGPDYGFERGDGDNRVCFCETYAGRIYGPVPLDIKVQPENHCTVGSDENICDVWATEEDTTGSLCGDISCHQRNAE